MISKILKSSLLGHFFGIAGIILSIYSLRDASIANDKNIELDMMLAKQQNDSNAIIEKLRINQSSAEKNILNLRENQKLSQQVILELREIISNYKQDIITLKIQLSSMEGKIPNSSQSDIDSNIFKIRNRCFGSSLDDFCLLSEEDMNMIFSRFNYSELIDGEDHFSSRGVTFSNGYAVRNGGFFVLVADNMDHGWGRTKGELFFYDNKNFVRVGENQRFIKSNIGVMNAGFSAIGKDLYLYENNNSSVIGDNGVVYWVCEFKVNIENLEIELVGQKHSYTTEELIKSNIKIPNCETHFGRGERSCLSDLAEGIVGRC